MRTGATFRLGGRPEHVTADVTARLGLKPSKTHETGDQVGRTPGNLRRAPVWTLTFGLQDDIELEVALRRLLEVLEPRREALWRLAGEGWNADWFCYVDHSFVLDRDLLERLLVLPGELVFDVYPED